MSEEIAFEKRLEVVKRKLKREYTETYEETIIREFKDPNIRSLSFGPSELVARAHIGADECGEAAAIDDLEMRKELIRITGMPEVPEKSDSAYREISGIFDDIFDVHEIDAVKWVRSVRRTR